MTPTEKENQEQEAYTPTGNTYDIKTIKQLFAIMTEENLPYLMTDLFKSGEVMLAVDAVNKSASKSAGSKYKKIELPVWRWIDDGKSELTEVTISDKKGHSFDIGEALRNIPNI